jgi:hypothetical protein
MNITPLFCSISTGDGRYLLGLEDTRLGTKVQHRITAAIAPKTHYILFYRQGYTKAHMVA